MLARLALGQETQSLTGIQESGVSLLQISHVLESLRRKEADCSLP